MRALLIRMGFVGLVSLLLTISLSAQRGGAAGARGEGPQGRGARGETGERGQRGGNAADIAERRKAIQAQQKAAIDSENARFRTIMESIQANAKHATDANGRAQAKTEADNARRNHQEAI